HVKSIKCLSCAFTLFFSMEVLELEACWYLLLNLYGSLVYMHIFHGFTNMGQPMCWWLHWKYHFMLVSPCTVLRRSSSSIFFFLFYGGFRTRSSLVFVVKSLWFTSLHAYFSWLHQHGPANVSVASLEISLHVSRPMHCLS